MAETMKRDGLIQLIRENTSAMVAEAVKDALESYTKELAKSRGNPLDDAAAARPVPVEKRGRVIPYIRAIAAAAITRSTPEQVAAEWNDPELIADIKNARADRQKALAAGTAADGGFLVPTPMSNEIIEFLRPMSVIRSLGPRVIQMPYGTFRVPKMSTGATATYIGENTNISATQQAFGQVALTFKKLAALVPISNDLIRYASMDSSAVIRDDLVASLAQAENSAFLRGQGVAGEPRGLRYWANAANLLLTAGAWTTLANCVADLGTMVLTLRNANVPMIRPAWIMSPTAWNRLMTLQNANGFFVFRQEMVAGALWGWPFGVTTQVPATAGSAEFYLVDMADAIIGESQNLIVDASTEAAYYDGSAVVASFSQDQTVVRAIMEHDFAMRRDVSVAIMTNLTI
jgi:HK97 family phage major capsid protein